MDPERRERYRDKLAHASERLGDLRSWLSDAPGSKLHRLASYKAFQEAVEALTDVLAMAVKDLGDMPRDDYRNIDRLEKDGRLSAAVAQALREANGLRNRIVHEYNGFWDDVGLEAMGRLVPALDGAVEGASAWH